MTFFRFFPDVICVEGEARSSIYSLSDGKVAQLSIEESTIVKMLKTESIETVELETKQGVVKNFINKMILLSLGTIYRGAVYTEPYLPHMPFELLGYLERPLVIEELFIDLYPNNPYKINRGKREFLFQGCNFCIPSTITTWDDVFAKKFFDLLKSNLDDIACIEVKKATFHIGDLKKTEKYLENIIESLVYFHEGIEFEFVMYFENLTTEAFSFVQRFNNATIVVCCLENVNLTQLYELCVEIMERNIDVIVSALLLNDINCYTKIKELCESLAIQLRTSELLTATHPYVFSVSRGEERLEVTDADSFYAKGKYSICQYGKIAIDAAGNIGSCLFGEKKGTLEKGLFKFFEEGMHTKLWEKPKKNYLPCSRCENRFCCIDCNYIEEYMGNEDIELKYSICSYDPEHGNWRDENLEGKRGENGGFRSL